MINIKRKYRFSDGKLVETVNQVLIGANRDVATLTTYGWEQTDLDALEQEKVDFSGLPTDGELSAMMAEKTEGKNTLRKDATNYVMKEIMARVELKWSEDNPRYKRFRVSKIHNESDGAFYLSLKRVARQASNLLADLADQGLLQTHIDAVDQFATDFNDSMIAQDQAIDDRDQAVQARVEAGNAMYAKLVKLADLGKRLWLNEDESKYNDYVIYPAEGGGEEEPPEQQVVESSVSDGATVNLSVTDIGSDTPMTVENTGANELFIYFSENPLDPPPADIDPLPAGLNADTNAAELGFAAGSREYLNVYNPGPDEGYIVVTAG